MPEFPTHRPESLPVLPPEAEAYVNLLKRLLDGQFSEVVLFSGIDSSLLPGVMVSLTNRAKAVVRLVLEQGGDFSALKRELTRALPGLKDEVHALADHIHGGDMTKVPEQTRESALPPEAEAYVNLLKRLLESQFSEVVLFSGIDSSLLPGVMVSLTNRAKAVVRLVLEQGGDFSALKRELTRALPGLKEEVRALAERIQK